jgi:hypothetical protein
MWQNWTTQRLANQRALPVAGRELRRLKEEIYNNPDAELDDRIKKLRQVTYKFEYRMRKEKNFVSGGEQLFGCMRLNEEMGWIWLG